MPKKNSLTSKEYWEKREAYKLKKGLKDLRKIEKELVEEYKNNYIFRYNYCGNPDYCTCGLFT